MSHILLVGDRHRGARGAHPRFEREGAKFDDFLLREIEENRPLAVVFMGDVFDDRVRMHVRTMNQAKDFFDRLAETEVSTFVLIGNHDINTRDSLRPNSVEPMLREYPSINAIVSPTEIVVDGTKILIVPWICSGNERDAMDAIATTDASVLLGHFEMIGFEITPGQFSNDGLDPGSLSRFDLVGSGHYHIFSKRDNVLYTGSAHQLTRSDAGQKKRLWKWNLDDKTLSSAIFDSEVFVNVELNESDTNVSVEDRLFDLDLNDKIVTIIVGAKVKDEIVARTIELCERGMAFDVKTVDSRTSLGEIDEEDLIEIQIAGTLEMIASHVDGDPDVRDDDKIRVKEILSLVHTEALGRSYHRI